MNTPYTLKLIIAALSKLLREKTPTEDNLISQLKMKQYHYLHNCHQSFHANQ